MIMITINLSHANNSRTKQIQEILIFQGFSVGIADGIEGKKTIKAIKGAVTITNKVNLKFKTNR